MTRLDFDPIEEAARHWGPRWECVDAMRAVTSVMRAQQLLIATLDGALRPYGLTFSRYEVLVLLTFSRSGSLPLGKIGERLQVHATSVGPLIRKLQASGFVERSRHPDDGRAFLAAITEDGRTVVEQATADLTAIDFGLSALNENQIVSLFITLRTLRADSGDF